MPKVTLKFRNTDDDSCIRIESASTWVHKREPRFSSLLQHPTQQAASVGQPCINFFRFFLLKVICMRDRKSET